MRCTQEETRMMEGDHPSNGNGSDPTAFTAHAKKRNNGGPRNQNHGRVGTNGRKGRCYTCNKFGHYARECLIEGTLPEMMKTTTSRGMEIKGTTGSKERGRLPLIEVEMGNLSRGQGIPSMMNLMLLIGKMNILLYLPSLLHLLSIH